MVMSESSPAQQGQDFSADEKFVMKCVKHGIESTFNQMCHFKFEDKPRVVKATHIKWQGKTRIIKPFEYSYVSVMTFRYESGKRARYEINGLITMFVTEWAADMLISALGLRGRLDESDIMDGCGEFLNVMAGIIREQFEKEGLEHLSVQGPNNYLAHVDELYEYYHDDKLEITYFKEEEPFVQVDISLDSIKKKR
jgi:hypothetical protein